MAAQFRTAAEAWAELLRAHPRKPDAMARAMFMAGAASAVHIAVHFGIADLRDELDAEGQKMMEKTRG